MKKGFFWLLLLIFPLWGNLYVGPQPARESFPYIDLGLGPLLPLPTLGVGYRVRSESRGFDVAARFSSIAIMDQCKFSALYLIYLTPEREEGYYLGFGGAWLLFYPVEKESSWGGSGEFVFGKQFTTKQLSRRFWQVQTGFPTYLFKPWDNNHLIFLPTPIFSYGFLF